MWSDCLVYLRSQFQTVVGAGEKARKKEKKEGWKGGREGRRKKRRKGGREKEREDRKKGGKKATWTGYIAQWQSFGLVMFENP